MLDKLRKYCREHKSDDDEVIIVVGYSQNYALEQHERMDYEHRVGQAKYLETAARVSEQEVRDILRNSPKEKLPESMLKAGLLIQRRSQELCPVDTSALKSSAFTSVEREVDQKAEEAHAKGERVRTAAMSQRSRK